MCFFTKYYKKKLIKRESINIRKIEKFRKKIKPINTNLSRYNTVEKNRKHYGEKIIIQI